MTFIERVKLSNLLKFLLLIKNLSKNRLRDFFGKNNKWELITIIVPEQVFALADDLNESKYRDYSNCYSLLNEEWLFY